jgi:hypothetical protein
VLSCTHCRKITEGKIPPFVVLRIGYDSILVFYLFSYLFVKDLPVQGNPVQENAVVVKQKSPESGEFRVVFGWTAIGVDAVRTRPNRRVSRGYRGIVRGLRGAVLAYNFLSESKTYIPVRWAFPVCEPRDIGIRISQWNQSCAFI